MVSSALEVSLAINAFANSGYIVKPYLLKKVAEEDSALAKREYVGVKLENLEIVKRGLIEVISAPDGTARVLGRLDLKIAGKTGTAQSQGRPHAWFVGFLPHPEPKYSICVFLENGGSSVEALRVTYNFLKRLKEENLI